MLSEVWMQSLITSEKRRIRTCISELRENRGSSTIGHGVIAGYRLHAGRPTAGEFCSQHGSMPSCAELLMNKGKAFHPGFFQLAVPKPLLVYVEHFLCASGIRFMLEFTVGGNKIESRLRSRGRSAQLYFQLHPQECKGLTLKQVPGMASSPDWLCRRLSTFNDIHFILPTTTESMKAFFDMYGLKQWLSNTWKGVRCSDCFGVVVDIGFLALSEVDSMTYHYDFHSDIEGGTLLVPISLDCAKNPELVVCSMSDQTYTSQYRYQDYTAVYLHSNVRHATNVSLPTGGYRLMMYVTMVSLSHFEGLFDKLKGDLYFPVLVDSTPEIRKDHALMFALK